jgi:D-amino-acid dehydrogenase
VAIIGAGIVGVSTAYELAALGHEVTVFERRSSVAEEASFAIAGVLAPGYAGPWAAPGMGWKVLRSLFSAHAAVRLGGLNALSQWPWMWRWWRACRPRVHAANRSAMVRLAQFSRERLLSLTRDLGLEFEQAPGFMVLMRTERDLSAARASLALMEDLGAAHELIDAERCRHLEPGLHTETPLHAAIHFPQDGVGNCRHFAHLLKSQAQRMGAHFRFDTTVHKVAAGSAPRVELAGAAGETFDAVVVCAGAQANSILAGVGLRLPLAAVHGYSVTAPLRHVDGLPPPGPRAAVMDERYKVAISRLGQRIRVSGMAELGGSLDDMAAAPLRTLYRILDDWFPGAASTREAQPWKGARPMLPDGPPVLGVSGAPGVWLNLGHGGSGWVLACGSARVLAEQISGRDAPLDVTGLSAARLR